MASPAQAIRHKLLNTFFSRHSIWFLCIFIALSITWFKTIYTPHSIYYFISDTLLNGLWLVTSLLSVVELYDLLQKKHAILINYPIIGHFRFFFDNVRPEIRQYFIEADQDALPFSRMQRSLVYQRAKNENADDIAEPQTLFGAQPEAEQSSKIFTSGIIEDKSPSHYQYKGTYIMNAVKSGLMIIDQHRAHVRILYEQYLAQLAAQKSATQTVLFPESFQLSASQRIVYEKIAEEMATMGFDIQDLGAGNYAINGIPAGLEGVNPVRLVVEMVDTAAENTVSIKEDIDESLALSMARNAAIPQGQVLSNIEMENIVNSLFLCKNPNVTPDGKTILCILKQSEIEHLLG